CRCADGDDATAASARCAAAGVRPGAGCAGALPLHRADGRWPGRPAAGAGRPATVAPAAGLAGPGGGRAGLVAGLALERRSRRRRPGLPVRRAASLALAGRRAGLAAAAGAVADATADAGPAGGPGRRVAAGARGPGLAIPGRRRCRRQPGLGPAWPVRRQRAGLLPLAAGSLVAAVLRGALAAMALARRLAYRLPGAGRHRL